MLTEINRFDTNGKRHGEWIVYYNNGLLSYIGNYSHGKRHGEWMEYNFDGVRCFICNYNNGKISGYYVTYRDYKTDIKRFCAR